MKTLMRDFEILGERGMVEEATQLEKRIELLRNTKNEIIMVAMNPHLASKQLKICEICGARQAINGEDKRNATHLEGKLHIGFAIIRKELEKLRKRLQAVELEIAVKKEELKKKREEESGVDQGLRKRDFDEFQAERNGDERHDRDRDREQNGRNHRNNRNREKEGRNRD